MATARMEKSIHTDENAVFLALLRDTRQAADLTQIEAAKRLGRGQSFVSKVERGEVRLDLIQLRTLCQAFGTSLPEFVAKLEERLRRKDRRK